MEWVLFGIITYILYIGHQRLSRLEHGAKESPIPEKEELLPMVDIAARAVDRHVADYHKR